MDPKYLPRYNRICVYCKYMRTRENINTRYRILCQYCPPPHPTSTLHPIHACLRTLTLAPQPLQARQSVFFRRSVPIAVFVCQVTTLSPLQSCRSGCSSGGVASRAGRAISGPAAVGSETSKQIKPRATSGRVTRRVTRRDTRRVTGRVRTSHGALVSR